MDPAYSPDPLRMPGVAAGPYLDAVADLGSAAASDGEVEAIADEFRREADRVSLEAGRFALVPTASPADCPVTSTAVDGVQVAPAVVRAGDEITVTAGASAVEVRLRRYADGFQETPFAVIDAGATVRLAVPLDTAPRQEWQVDLRSIGTISVCE